MKDLFFIIGISACIAIGSYLYGYRAGETAVQNAQKEKVVQTTVKIKDDTERLNKELETLKQKLKEAKKYEECSYILNYPVNKCLHD